MKKIIIFGLLGGVIVLAVGMVTGQLYQMIIPSVKTEFENPSLFRPWTDPLMSLFFVHPFLLGIILAWVWTKVNPVIHADSDWMKGIYFGAAVWLASSVPGMFISYSSFPISLAMILSWTISGLIELLCLGIFFSKVLKNDSKK